MWMNNKSRLIKSVVKLEILLNEIKKDDFHENRQALGKKMICVLSILKLDYDFQNKNFKGKIFLKLIRFFIIKSVCFIYIYNYIFSK